MPLAYALQDFYKFSNVLLNVMQSELMIRNKRRNKKIYINISTNL